MAERCPACSAHVDDTNVSPGGPLRCDKCGTRFPKARQPRRIEGGAPQTPLAGALANRGAPPKDDAVGLGIHPALAKRYREKNSLPPQDGDRGPGVAGDEMLQARALPDVDPGPTNPGRPLGRRSGEGAPLAPAPPSPAPPVVPPPARGPLPPVPAAHLATADPGERQEPVPIIPGYLCTELVGKGAMGRVYRATRSNARTGQGPATAAIKILAPELASRPDFIARFEREGAAMRAVRHPGVVTVLDAGASVQPDGTTAHFIAMEFIEGSPLRRHLDRGALSPELALRYARRIIQGLGAAHARGVIHRDLKPENILAPPDAKDGEIDRLVLVDFGLAGILDEENDPHPNLTKSRMTMGTVNYMAPEQRTDAKRVDQRADLYAAGVIFYELLTGDLPLGRFALPTERAVPVPASVDRCIVRALARNPEERYQNAAQFDADLRAIEDEITRNKARETVIGRTRPVTGSGNNNQRAMLDERGGRSAVYGGNVVAGAMLPSLASVTDGSATEWGGAVPWLKRPLLQWGAGALLVGALLGVALKFILH